MIQVVCKGCGARFSVKEDNAGKKGKCSKCGALIEIVAPKPKRKPRVASEKQKRFATDLGIQFDEAISSRELSTLIDAALEREQAITTGEIDIEPRLKTLRQCEPSDMVEELQKRGLKALLFYWQRDDEEPGRFSYQMTGTDGLTEEDVHRVIVRCALLAASREDTDILALMEKYASG